MVITGDGHGHEMRRCVELRCGVVKLPMYLVGRRRRLSRIIVPSLLFCAWKLEGLAGRWIFLSRGGCGNPQVISIIYPSLLKCYDYNTADKICHTPLTA
jgi:hypothetical protein